MIRKSSLKRSAPPKRKKSIKRSAVGRRGAELRRLSPLRKVNPERAAKRRANYRKKLAAYRRSETYKVVEARSGGQCEHRETVGAAGMWLGATWINHEWAGVVIRCSGRRADGVKLTHHHLTYARFGGKELPEDIVVLCQRHNAEAESQHPTRKRGRVA